jgi:inositol-pentakisphosphate 2-kinase
LCQTQELESWRGHLSSTASVDLDSLESLTGAMLSVLRPALSSDSQLATALQRLAQLQRRLDALDVEGLAARWRSETGCAFGSCSGADGTTSEEASVLLAPPTLEEYAAVVQLFLAHEQRLGRDSDEQAVRQTQAQLAACPLRQATLAFLLSATFKDCSIMLRCLPGQETDTAWRLEVRLIDLDPKPLARLAHYEALDREIVECFATWCEAQK